MLKILLACGLSTLSGTSSLAVAAAPDERTLYVDPAKGARDAEGSRGDPLKTIAGALERLPEPLEYDIEIPLAAGNYDTTGGEHGARRSLQLWHRMAPEVAVRFIGPESGAPAVLDWNGGRRMIDVREGRWYFVNLQVRSFKKEQRRGVMVTGPGQAVVDDVTMRLRSSSDAGLYARDGGRIHLRNTPTTVRAARKGNWAIGLEHDGHILAEDAHITIVGPGESAIALQKASTFTCNDIELQGDFKTTLWAASGSMFVGRFLTDITGVEAQTGAGIHIEKIAGEVKGPITAESGAVISLPDRVVR